MKKQQAILAILSLFCGGLIYLCFRSSSLLMFKLIEFLHLGVIVIFLRKAFLLSSFMPKWVIYSLPDGLWMFSCTSLILNVWNNRLNKQSMVWIISMPAIAILSEFLQLFHLIRGTFDILDIASYLIGFTAAFFIYSNPKR